MTDYLYILYILFLPFPYVLLIRVMSSINSREAITKYPQFNAIPAAFSSTSISSTRAENSAHERTSPWPMPSTVYFFCFSKFGQYCGFSVLFQFKHYSPDFAFYTSIPKIKKYSLYPCFIKRLFQVYKCNVYWQTFRCSVLNYCLQGE